jgi:CheY-like chemotaxis protein
MSAGGEGVMLIALTGWGQPADRQRSAEAGFDLHLVKPIDLFEISDLIASAPKRSPA